MAGIAFAAVAWADPDTIRPLLPARHLLFDTGTLPARIAAGDLDGDGRPDVVTANNGFSISVLLNRGHASFGPNTVTPFGSIPFAGIVVGDFTNDGDADIAVANYSNDYLTNTVTLFRGHGDGTLTQGNSYAVGITPNDLIAGFVDGDANLDLVTANQNADSTSAVSVLLGHGDGTFTVSNVSAGTHAYALVLGDVNDDGRSDLVVANASSATVSVLIGNGDGSFQTRRVFGVGSSPVAVAIADATGDGVLDIVAANYVSDNVSVLAGDGSGEFTTASTFPVPAHPIAMRAADLDHDGSLDVVTLSETQHTVGVSIGHGNGTFDAPFAYAGMVPTALLIDDVNRDGWPDVVTTHTSQNAVGLMLGNGDGTFGVVADSLVTGPLPTLVAVGDFNHDGLPDLVSADDVQGAVPGAVSMFLNAGGGFRPRVAYPVGVNPYSIAVGDLNHDNKVDVVTANEGSDSVTVLFGADSTLVSRADFYSGPGSRFATLGSVNGDAHTDLVVTNYTQGKVSVLLGDGSGGFGPRIITPVSGPSGPVEIAVADLNTDGKQDLVVANYAPDSASVLLGNGDGTFQAAQRYATGDGPYSVAIGDLDHDGKLDFAVSSIGDDLVSVWFGVGNGTFTGRVNIAAGRSPGWVRIADMDGDGLQDVVTANSVSRTISIVAGLGARSFGARTDCYGGFTPYAFTIGDVDANGRPDVITANQAQNTLAVMMGPPNGPAITSFYPPRGGNSGYVTVSVSGARFQPGAHVRLSRIGSLDISGFDVTVAPDGTSLVATVDLTGVALGDWDLAVINPNGLGAARSGFTIARITTPQLSVHLIGPPKIRAGRRYPYDIVIQNSGNVDAANVPVWLAGVPSDATLDLDFTVSSPPRGGGEPDWSQLPVSFSSPGGRYVPFVIPRVAPGISVRRLYLSVAATPAFALRAAITPPWDDGNVFRGCIVNAGITNLPCLGAQLTAVESYLDATPTVATLSGIGVWTKIAWSCEGAGTLAAAIAKAEQVLDYMEGPVESPAGVAGSCAAVLPPRWADSLLVTIVGAIDPNDKLGERATVSTQQPIIYSIRFENLRVATAPAQTVIVTDPLNTMLLDPATVSLGDIKFGSRRIIPPPGLSSFATTVDLRPGRNLLVSISVGIDPISHALSWSFYSIDPATGLPTLDPEAGFLPPNITPPEGEGSVLFTVMPRAGIAGGTVIHNTASITFDDTTRTTPDLPVTVDDAAPTSHVIPLPEYSDTTPIPVTWAGDGSPDLRDFTICVIEDHAPARVWRLDTRATSDTLVPPPDHRHHSYAFYSVARDMAGNVEASPVVAATTQFRLDVRDAAAALSLVLEGTRPNPVAGPLRVWFTLPSRGAGSLDLIDVAGRRVLRRDIGTLEAGPHSMSLDTSRPLRPGLYFLRLTHPAGVRTTRVAVVR